jgi:hypothetical protein
MQMCSQTNSSKTAAFRSDRQVDHLYFLKANSRVLQPMSYQVSTFAQTGG